MPPKGFLPVSASDVDSVLDSLPEDSDARSDSSPPELVDPASLEESSGSEDGHPPTTESHDPNLIGITVSAASHSSKKELCLQEIQKVAASHGFTMTVFSPVSSRPHSPLPACESRSSSPTLLGCPHNASHHVRCHDAKGSYCVVRRSGNTPVEPPRSDANSALDDNDLERLFSYMNKGWSYA